MRDEFPDTAETTTGRAAAWLSEGVERLVARLREQPRPPLDFDVLVVGSGYGGAVAASGLSNTGQGVRVCVLERGKEYLQGAFPARMADLAGHVRFSTEGAARPQGQQEGLFDFKVGTDVSALVASGVGGGSLINAGVMAEPSAEALARLEASVGPLAGYYPAARQALGAQDNTILHRAGPRPLKFVALQALAQRLAPAGAAFSAAPVTVAMTDKANSAGVALDACVQCGDCATGCNFNAKDSLDTNLLVRARRGGAVIYSGATVLRFERDAARQAWRVHVTYTDTALRKKDPKPFSLYVGKLILAAGTYGSTEILLRSRSAALPLSPALGRRFSSNGDLIALAYAQAARANALSDEDAAPAAREVGPTITGMVRVPGARGQLLIEELAVPGALRRLFEEMATTANALSELAAADRSDHTPDQDGQDPCAIDPRKLAHTSVLALMGDDGAAGRMQLVASGVKVVWPELRQHPLFDEQMALLAAAGAGEGGAAANGVILANPMWKLLPPGLEYLMSSKRGPLLTVHPLGGCAIGADASAGVVNAHGQVYLGGTADPAAVHASLVVLDGSVIPQALGVNPALTITAVALRAVQALRAEWKMPAPPDAYLAERRPLFQQMAPVRPAAPTAVQFIERMRGPVTLDGADGRPLDCMAELTLRFEPANLTAMFRPADGFPVRLRRRLTVGADSTLAVYSLAEWRRRESDPERNDPPPLVPLASAPLSGTLEFMQREPSGHRRRVWSTLVPWLRNRGLRDTWQWLAQLLDRPAASGGAGARLGSALALASRAGEVRRFDYMLSLGAVRYRDATLSFALADLEIRGDKRLTYGFAANPWTQLMTMNLRRFPALRAGAAPATLKLDTGFLVKENIALLRVLGQHDQPGALSDLAALAGYLLRVLLHIHLWSFRKPDTPRPRTPQRLPGKAAGLPPPQTTHLCMRETVRGKPVKALLTRYPQPGAGGGLPPVIMIHGYSASGTTFAHELVDPSLASYMWARGRDVWILDMRTSSGMPTACEPWTFEDAAHADIPAAIAHICEATASAKVDVVAHCMGAAMFGMAILGPPEAGARFEAERRALPGRIGRVVLSQVGPLVVFTQANIFRAYLMGWVRNLLPRARMPFRVDGEPTLGDELLDRVLATLPYPAADFRIENPAWPWQRAEFVGTRHRMDALYGRDFELPNVAPALLDRIDDFFGPYNLETLSQAMHLARLKTIATRAGRNPYVSREHLRAYWTFPTLSIHGARNGLSDVATLSRMKAVFEDAGRDIHIEPFAQFGHQDCWIGRDARQVFERVDAFLAPPLAQAPATAPPATLATSAASTPAPVRYQARIPWAGPVLTGLPRRDRNDELHIPVGAATGPVMNLAVCVLFVPVVARGGHFEIWNQDGGADLGQVFMQFVDLMPLTAPHGDKDGWIQLTPRVAPDGADGMLMLMIHDEVNTLAPEFFPARDVPPAYRYGDLMQYFRHLGLLDYTWAPALRQQLEAELPALTAAVRAELAAKPADALRAGLIETPAPAPIRTIGRAQAPSLCFAAASCQYPPGLLDEVPAYASYRRLAARLDRADGEAVPRFLLLMGDQIYADASAGLFDPSALDDRYVRPYERLLGNVAVQSVLRRLPAYMMLDDHEISDNWETPAAPGARDANREPAIEAYRKYQRTGDLAPAAAGPGLWRTFEQDGFHFFLADTRSERAARTPACADTANIMGFRQFRALLKWLRASAAARAGEAPMFIASGSMLAPLRVAGRDSQRYDNWQGYPASLHRLLGFIARRGIRNLVFLSGDEHLSCDATLTLTTPGGQSVTVRSIHSSALYAPYPFANTQPADLADSGSGFSFVHPRRSGRRYSCTVDYQLAPGDGYAVLRAQGQGANWRVTCEFDRD